MLNYIDFFVIKQIYFKIWCIATISILFDKVVFGSLLLTSADIGLIVEYMMYLSQISPNMSPAFLNTLILFIGFTVGILMEIFIWKNKRKV